MISKNTFALILLFFLVAFAQAQVRTLAHYNMGRSGNVTYAIAPEVLKPVGKAGTPLTVIGTPVFYADAPGDKAGNGEGSILFSGKGDGYLAATPFGKAGENLLFEVWVKGRVENNADGNITPKWVVASTGSESSGYQFVQNGKSWSFNSGGKGSVQIGEVIKDQWVHLAAVVENGEGTVWFNGKKSGTFEPTQDISNSFSIACDAEGKSNFYGEIYEVRVGTFDSGHFDSNASFLLDYEKIAEKSGKQLEERQAFVKILEAEGMGKKLVSDFSDSKFPRDWLITSVGEACRLEVKKSADQITSEFRITNGLVSRSFYISDNLACVSYKNHSNQAEFLRAVKPEARLLIDSTWYEVGGLKGQPELSYLLESWLPEMENSPSSFVLKKIETAAPVQRYPWTPKFNSIQTDWPAKGLRVIMTYAAGEAIPALKDIEVQVNYEIYQGLPVMAKWVEVKNSGSEATIIQQIETEVLAVNQDQLNRIHVESDFSFALVNGNTKGSALLHFVGEPKPYQAGEGTTKWRVDPDYHTWATHNQAEDNFLGFRHRNLLVSTLPMGPNTPVTKENPFKSYITFELLQDSDDEERKSLGHRRMYKKLAPQTTESLIAGGITSHDPVQLKSFIDQMGELGLERLDIQAWPGISHDNLDSEYVALWKDIASYARSKGIVMGGYELQVASRGRGAEVDCVDPATGKPGSLFGQSVCIASAWKDSYYPKMWEFFDQTGMMTYNMDGPYHGDPCASHSHTHHSGLEDSQWQQWKTQVGIIHELQRRDMYVPIPDWYFLNGQSATGMGYREASANLTPQQQLLLGRQYIYDGTWHKLPTMGWMTMQLVGFYTHDPRVGLEPLNENLDRYEAQLVQYLASGCQFTIRGNRLYDTPETKAMAGKWINWFKAHREILTSEIIHVSRPTGRDLDIMMHVNPFIEDKGMVVVFNPTNREIKKVLELPLYYTGLKNSVEVSNEELRQDFSLNEKQELSLTVKIKPGGVAWYLLK
ncbi:hypothetical protein GCM10009119_23760 [Algoriphagus jejuensis]|uniref:Concanavalin A-like lectin/glucanase superfamily protein n=1 Tax=Algoriphagus jejuensis TaxID=419934 RepID=A0ABP3YEB1_9BACT